MVAGTIILALAAWWMGAAAGYIVLMTMASALFPIRTVYHQEVTSPVWRSAMSGVVTLSMQFGRAVVVILGGFLVAGFGYTGMFMAAAFLTFAGTLFFWFYLGTLGHRLAMTSVTD